MIMLSSFFTSCTNTSTKILISFDSYTFARTGEDGQLVVVDEPAVFKLGEDVHMILMNVGPFKKDSTGLNWFDIDMEVTGPDGETIISEKGLLGDAGHLNLENDIAGSPYATFTSSTELKPGDYLFKVTIYDRIGKGKVSQKAAFKLE